MRFGNNLGNGWEIRVGSVEALLWIAISLAMAYASYLAGTSVGQTAKQSRLPEPSVVLEGVVESIKHQNEKTGLTVILFKPNGSGESITMVGKYPQSRPGLKVRVEGSFVVHPRFGRQFRIKNMQLDYPVQAETSSSNEDDRNPGDEATSPPAAELVTQPELTSTAVSNE
jgi:hypothetical protein